MEQQRNICCSLNVSYTYKLFSLRIEEDTEKSKLRSMLMLKILKKLTEL
jgi:hypothetical protein